MLTRTEKLNIGALCIVAILCVGVLIHAAFNTPTRVTTGPDEDYPISMIDARKVFDASKTAPKLWELTDRYETASPATLDSVFAAIYFSYLDSLNKKSTHSSFGNYIDRYYHSNANDTINPWIRWYETQGQNTTPYIY